MFPDQSATTHQQYPTNYSNQYPEQQQADMFNADTYNNTAYMQPGVAAYATDPYSSAAAYSSTNVYSNNAATGQYRQTSPPLAQQPHATVERSYTLGGDGYGSNTVPVLNEPQRDDSYYPTYPTESHLPSPYSPLPSPNASHITTAAAPASAAGPSTSLRPPSPDQPMYEDSPPMYDDATAQPPGEWSSKTPRNPR